jgi:hypothetical protein
MQAQNIIASAATGPAQRSLTALLRWFDSN